MNMASAQSALQQYNSVGVQSGIESANPHRIIQMLMAGALDRIAAAKGFLQRGDIGKKGEYIGWSISIIEGLRASLDHDAGGDISGNLDSLYEYMSRRLLEANIKGDEAILDEVFGLLSEIKGGWDAIPEEMRDPQAVRAAMQENGGV